MKTSVPLLATISVLLLQGCDPPATDAWIPGPLAALFTQGGATAHAGILARDTVVATARPFPLRTPEGPATPDGDEAVHGEWWAATDWVTGDVVAHRLDGSETRRVTRNEAPWIPGFGMVPRFSPDGARLAFTWIRNEGGSPELRVGDLEGGEPRSILAVGPEGWVDAADWSPDGSSVLARVIRDDGTVQLVAVPTDGSEPRILRSLGWSQPRAAVFSPDGRWVAFDFAAGEDSRVRNIHVVAADGTRGRPLVEGDSDDWVLGWSPDGQLLFASDRLGTPGAWRIRVREGRTAGSAELVKPDLWRIAPVGFDEEGRFFYFHTTGGPEVRITGMDPESDRPIGPTSLADPRAVGTTSQPAWSPDGRHLAYLVEHAPFGGGPLSDRAVRIRALESGEVREFRMPPRAHGLSNPRWTPDGRAILLRAQYDRGQTSLLRLDVQTGEVERLLRNVNLYPVFELLPDGRRIVHTENLPAEAVGPTGDGPRGGQRLLVRELDGEGEVELYRHVAQTTNSNLALWRLAVSPDGEQVAFTRTRIWDPVEGRSADLVVLPIGGGEPRILVEELDPWGVGALAWSPDGESLLYLTHPLAGPLPDDDAVDPNVTVVWRVALAGGEPRELARFDERIQHFRPHPEGRRLAFGTADVDTELWVLEDISPVQPRAEGPGGG